MIEYRRISRDRGIGRRAVFAFLKYRQNDGDAGKSLDLEGRFCYSLHVIFTRTVLLMRAYNALKFPYAQVL